MMILLWLITLFRNEEVHCYARRKHFTTNIIIELAGDNATVISNFLVVRDGESGPAISVAGTYDDIVVRTAEGWKFKSQRLSHDIAESGLNVKPG